MHVNDSWARTTFARGDCDATTKVEYVDWSAAREPQCNSEVSRLGASPSLGAKTAKLMVACRWSSPSYAVVRAQVG